jgi:alpha-L-arabinofuranosidase
MSKKFTRYPILCSILCWFLSWNAFSQTGNHMVVDITKAQYKISREIYGHFAEHLGNCIYGGIYVGEKSPIPNIHGIRKDVLEALKEIHVPVLRWPGGCFADTYHWKDGIGPVKERPSMINIHWGGVTEDNSFGTHEFLDFCELLNTQPYVSGNVGSGTVQEMSQWIEYITSDALSPMTKLRKENGRENPWKLKYLGVGNEPWGCGGQMTPDYYSNLFRQYSNYCRDYGKNRLVRVAAGPSGDDYANSEILIKNLAPFMQAFSVHYYTVWPNWNNKGSSIDFNESSWYPILKNALKMEEIVTRQSTLLDKYNPEKSIGLFVDEWGTWYEVEPGTNPGFLYQQNSLRDAIVAASTLNIFNNHCERVKMANIAQTVNVLQAMVLTKGEQIVKTPTYYVFKMFAIHQDAIMVPISLESSRSSSSESDLQLINASVSLGKDGELNITTCNLDAKKEQNLTIEIKGDNYTKILAEIITGSKINSYNDFGKPEEVQINSFDGVKLRNSSIELTLPAHSVVLIKLMK